MISDKFGTNAASAIQQALARDTPLLILIGNNAESTKVWERMVLDKGLSVENRALIENDLVSLRVNKPSLDYTMLSDTFSEVAGATPPALFAIYRGMIVEQITSTTTVKDANLCLLRLKKKWVSKKQISSVTNSRSHESRPEVTDVAVTQIRSGVTNSIKVKHPEAESTSSKIKSELEDQPNHKRVKKNEEAKLEDMGDTESGHEVMPNYHRSGTNEMLNASQIRVKLIDGAVTCFKFPSDCKLSLVRDHVVEQHKEYQQIPFQFFRAIDRFTFTPEDENSTLHELQLNKCTLIIKPMDPFEAHQKPDNIGGSSTFSWMKRKLGALFWGNNDQVPIFNSPKFGEQTRSLADGLRETTMISQHPGLDSDTESDAVYQSPENRSTISRSSSPFEPSLNISSSDSNFDIRGISNTNFLSNPNNISIGTTKQPLPKLKSIGINNSAASSKTRLAEISDCKGELSESNIINMEDSNDDKVI
ncbi:hypothetical protein OGAPHI_001309 [Ogataea philodendri]|uniref:UBX domain-containing protein n=1 Tax=Ogataea philodendri TaxID=1378263 RepID=A0A9P8PEI1_9ASCO|nr:uncharacterized protein OGAPHI_001309 [Ogataea philodendri]KAH3670793.1 hypothetical protein OGAPHI_001309 [Ogataea philodendri]